jgi:hypothetical protein
MRIENSVILAIFLTGAMVILSSPTSFASTPTTPEEVLPALAGVLELQTSEVVMGEPLVARAGLRNIGKTPFLGTYALPGTFNRNAKIEFTVITPGRKEIRIHKEGHGDATVYKISPKILEQLGDRAPAVKSGESVFAARTVPLAFEVDGRWVWLAPGTYKVRAKISIQHLPDEYSTPELTFTIKPLSPQDQGVLAILTPDLAILLGGDQMAPLGAAPAKAEQLRKEFPKAPHRQYLEYQLLWSTKTLDVFQASCQAYLEEFPKSPYFDDVLFRLAKAKPPNQAVPDLERLLKDFPQSVRRAEAEELLDKIKESQDMERQIRDAARKAAPTATGRNPSPTSTPGAAGPSANPTGT